MALRPWKALLGLGLSHLKSLLDKVATWGYLRSMRDIKTVGVKDLKNNLSAYLREVRRGTRVLVSDRNSVVAELREPGAVYGLAGPGDPVMMEWIEAGVVAPPIREKRALPPSPLSLLEGVALRLLDDDRGESRT